MVRYLIDTNVLVYGFDGSAPARQAAALGLIARLGRPGPDGPIAALPAQVLAKFARVATGRLRPPLAPDDVFEQVGLYEQVFPVIALTAAVVLEAVRRLRDHGFSYYDAQIWAVARLHQIPVVLSEDFASGSTVGGVTFTNPFAPEFDIGIL